jgi:hypothetical protein
MVEVFPPCVQRCCFPVARVGSARVYGSACPKERMGRELLRGTWRDTRVESFGVAD